MKLYKLIYGDNVVPTATSNDKWLLKLFVVQRKLNKNICYIQRMKPNEQYGYPDQFLIYYFGYAVTSMEYRYICNMNAEYESDIYARIYELENVIVRHKDSLTKKEIKYIKKSIKALKRLDLSKDKNHAKVLISNVIERPGLIRDYLSNLDSFREYMDAELE